MNLLSLRLSHSIPIALLALAACGAANAQTGRSGGPPPRQSQPVNFPLGPCGPRLREINFVPFTLQEIRTMTGDQTLQITSRISVDKGPAPSSTPSKVFVSGGTGTTTVQGYIDELNEMEKFMNTYGYTLRNPEVDLICEDVPNPEYVAALNKAVATIKGAHTPVVLTGRDGKPGQGMMTQGSICRVLPMKKPAVARNINARTNTKPPFLSWVSNWPVQQNSNVTSANIDAMLANLQTNPRWPGREAVQKVNMPKPGQRGPLASAWAPGVGANPGTVLPSLVPGQTPASFTRSYQSQAMGLPNIAQLQFRLDADGSATANTAQFHAYGQAQYSRLGSPMIKALDVDANVVVNKNAPGTFNLVLKDRNGTTVGAPISNVTPINWSGTLPVYHATDNQIAIVMIGPVPVTIRYSYNVNAQVNYKVVAGTGSMPAGVPATSQYLPIVAYAEVEPKASVDAAADASVNLMLVRVGVETNLQLLWHESRFTGAALLNYNSVKQPYIGLYADGLSDTRGLCGTTGGPAGLVNPAPAGQLPGGQGYLNGYLEYPKIKLIPPSKTWKRVTRKLFSWSGFSVQGYVFQVWDEFPL